MIFLWYCIQVFGVVIQNQETKENLMCRLFQVSASSFMALLLLWNQCYGEDGFSARLQPPHSRFYFFIFIFFCGTRASHCRGLSRCGAQALDAQAQRPWLTGLAAPRHVGSSQTGARTCVPWISRRALNHCATREALNYFLIHFISVHIIVTNYVNL